MTFIPTCCVKHIDLITVSDLVDMLTPQELRERMQVISSGGGDEGDTRSSLLLFLLPPPPPPPCYWYPPPRCYCYPCRQRDKMFCLLTGPPHPFPPFKCVPLGSLLLSNKLNT